MNLIATLWGAALFFSGAAASLLASYPIPAGELYVCFVALFLGIAAGTTGVGAFILYSGEHHRIRMDHLVRATADRLTAGRRLELVDDGD